MWLQDIPALPQSLVLLSAQNNQLTSLPPSLARCTSLTKLDVAHNMLQELPDEVWDMKFRSRALNVMAAGDEAYESLLSFYKTTVHFSRCSLVLDCEGS
jgi:Leucine-rich repeat (LRR) protein